MLPATPDGAAFAIDGETTFNPATTRRFARNKVTARVIALRLLLILIAFGLLLGFAD